MGQVRLHGFAKALIYGETQVGLWNHFFRSKNWLVLRGVLRQELRQKMDCLIQIGGCVSTVIQSAGIGGLKPNTLLLSWPLHINKGELDSEYHTFTGSVKTLSFRNLLINSSNFHAYSELVFAYLDKLLAGAAMDMCLLVVKGITEFPVSVIRLTGKIDVYWIVQDGGLCVLVAYLLRQSKVLNSV